MRIPVLDPGNGSKPRVLVGYFLDEPGFQGPTVALLRYIEETHPELPIDLLDLTRHTNSSSFAHTAKVFGIQNPLKDYVDHSQQANWLVVPRKTKYFEIQNDQFQASISSDLYSSFKTDPLPSGPIRRLLEKKFAVNGNKIYGLTTEIISRGNYRFAYVLNGRHSANAAFWIACEESSIETFFWESGDNFDTVHLCSHPVHDFYANRDEAFLIEQKSAVRDLSKAEQWMQLRISNKGEAAFRGNWDSDITAAYFGESTTKRRITYFSSSTDEYMSLGRLAPPRNWKNQYESLENLRLDPDDESVTITIRMHPNTLNKSVRYCAREVKRLFALKRLFSDVEILWPGSKVDSYDLLENSDLVLSSGSTVALESMYLGRPTYLVDRSSYSYASNKTLIDYSQTIDDLIKQCPIENNKRTALIEIALQLRHEKITVSSTDKVKGWNVLLSIMSYRDAFRVFHVATSPIRKQLNRLIFWIAGAYITRLGNRAKNKEKRLLARASSAKITGT